MYKLKKDLNKGTVVSESFAKDNPELVEKVGGRRWRAEKDGEYFYVRDAGYIDSMYEDGDHFDDFRYSQGNYFQTREEAEEYLEILTIEGELRELCDWDGEDMPVLMFTSNDIDIETSYSNTRMGNKFFFESDQSAKAAIKEVGKERIIKWLKYYAKSYGR